MCDTGISVSIAMINVILLIIFNLSHLRLLLSISWVNGPPGRLIPFCYQNNNHVQLSLKIDAFLEQKKIS